MRHSATPWFVFATPPTGMGYHGKNTVGAGGTSSRTGTGGGPRGGSKGAGPLFGAAYIDPSVSLDFSGGKIERIIRGGGR